METTQKKALFSYENYETLSQRISKAAGEGDADAKEDVRMLKRAMDSYFNYVQTVNETETRIKIARFRYDVEEYQEVAITADRARRIAHEAAISNISIMNRLALFYGVEPVYLGAMDDRYEVSDFCMEVTDTVFASAQKGN